MTLADTAKAIIDEAVGTAGEPGTPWAAPVFSAHAGYRDFLWISAPEAARSRNLAVRPEAGIVIFDSGVRPGEGQAVYMAAEAGEETDLASRLRHYPGDPARGTPAVTHRVICLPDM
ncbi:pyridoxamine 5'-phosphate oxidase family protein [Nonomuraea typhae]|uniref:pyridoxamine 5'-phosphate oxidase family protein n=1 Tax=Nonomuraea typhae TaxID=2603600 RepID=UPI0012F946F5|nr:pyridoxamine 5'-phosphate oxidase family protein [Nonomuraea typhae]